MSNNNIVKLMGKLKLKAFVIDVNLLFFLINAIHANKLNTKYTCSKVCCKIFDRTEQFHSEFQGRRKTARRLEVRTSRISVAGTAAEFQPLKSKTLMKFSFCVQGSSPSSKYIGHRSTEIEKFKIKI